MQVTSIGSQKEEGFYTTYLRGRLNIKANNEKAAQQALHFWDVAEKSGHIGDFLGASKPRFSTRCLLWKGDVLPDDWEQRLLAWGFNAIITELSVESTLIQVFSRSKGTFYKSVLTSELRRDLTTGERLLEEIKSQEKGEQLLFCLPSWVEPEWVWSISEDVGANTVLVFDADRDSMWQSFRQEIYSTKTAFMVLFKDQNQINTLNRCGRHHFAGAIVPLSEWPKPESEAEGALWVAGQSQWWGGSSELLAETWLKKSQLRYIIQ